MHKVIKKVEVEHLDALAVLFDRYRVFYKELSDLEGAKDFLKGRIEREESAAFISFEKEGDASATGFVQLYPLFSSTRMKKLWLLNDLFVHPDYRGQQYGVALIETAKNFCRETTSCGLLLETAKDNREGNALYPKMGFELDDQHNYYTWDCQQ